MIVYVTNNKEPWTLNTPFEKYNFKQYLNEHKSHFQNVDKT